MWYVIYTQDQKDGLARRAGAREAHLQRVRKLLEQGRLLLAGPRPAIDSPDPGPADFAGSLIVARFESLEAARAWAEADPYVTAGVYREVEVTPFIPVLP